MQTPAHRHTNMDAFTQTHAHTTCVHVLTHTHTPLCNCLFALTGAFRSENIYLLCLRGRRTKCSMCVCYNLCVPWSYGGCTQRPAHCHAPSQDVFSSRIKMAAWTTGLPHPRTPSFSLMRANGSATLFFLSELIGDILSQSHYLSTIACRVAEAGLPLLLQAVNLQERWSNGLNTSIIFPSLNFSLYHFI